MSGESASGRQAVRGLAVRLRPQVWLVSFVAWSVVSMVMALALSRDLAARGQPVSWGQVMGGSIWNAALWALGSPAIAWLACRYPIAREGWLTRLTTHFVVGLAWVCTVNGISTVAQLIARDGAVPAITEIVANVRALDLVVDMTFFWIVFSIGQALQQAQDESARRDEAHELTRRNVALQGLVADAELRALRARLRPHFIGNTLNAAASLIRRGDPERAIAVLSRLAGLMRRAFAPGADDVVPFEQELSFGREYLEVEDARLDGALGVEWDIALETRAASVPAFLIQPLLENAIVHGAERVAGPTTIRVRSRIEGASLVVEVENSGSDLPADAEDTIAARHGIRLTRERLRLLFGERSELTLRGTGSGTVRATVRIPLSGRNGT